MLISNNTRIATSRTTLAPLSVADAPFMFELMMSPSYLRFIGDRGLASIQDTENYIDSYFLKSAITHGFGYFVATNAKGARVGTVGFMQKEYLKYPDIGFAFLPQFSGLGLAYEVSQAALEYARDEWHLTNLDAVTDSDNAASKNLLKRLNFEFIEEIRNPENQQCLQLYGIRV
ncbi:MAG: ribosomal-protein-alanine N-acetyltransferase [Arenicella sp.]|jgi:ribosomal-protein-alanine N-acetyltransferase